MDDPNDWWAVLAPVNAYADGCDRRDWAHFDQVFADDAVGEYGDRVREGRAAIVAMIESMLAGCGPTQHQLSNQRVQIDGDAATSVCRIRATHQSPDDPARMFEVWGWYHDDLRRTADGWRIINRRMVVDHQFGDRSVLAPSVER